ncbi:GTPase RsgA, partial [Acinetobacter baumannii]
SNIDQSLLFVTLKSPKTSLGFIDRFLIACESFHIPATIVFNKADIYREKEIQQYERYREIYTDIGYDVLLTSVEKG